MSAAVDANVLLYASDEGHPLSVRARDLIATLTRDGVLFLPWPVLFAYLRVSTHPRVYERPLSADAAMENVRRLLALPSVRPLCETRDFWKAYAATVDGLHPRGNAVPDAHVAALLRANGVGTIYTNDADFRRFDFLDVRNPFR